MNKVILLIVATAALFAIQSQAGAVTLTVSVIRPLQTGQTNAFTAGLIVYGTTSLFELSVAGGFTVNCEYNVLPITAQAGSERTDLLSFGFLDLLVDVPDPVPGFYPTAGFDAISARSCKVCNFAWKASAIGRSVEFSGRGVDFSLPTGAEIRSNTVTFQMCKAGTGSCDRQE